MSAPGDPGRTLAWVEGPSDQIVVKAIELIGTIPGASSFELSYTARDRVLDDDEEPDDGEAVVWTATALVRRRYGKTRTAHTYTGTCVADPATRTPAGGQPQAIVLAVIELLEKLGANVVAMFPDYPTTTTEETHP